MKFKMPPSASLQSEIWTGSQICYAMCAVRYTAWRMAHLECACIVRKTSASSACTLFHGQLIAFSARKLPIGIKKKATIPSTTFWCMRRKHQVSEDFEKGAGSSRAFRYSTRRHLEFE